MQGARDSCRLESNSSNMQLLSVTDQETMYEKQKSNDMAAGSQLLASISSSFKPLFE